MRRAGADGLMDHMRATAKSIDQAWEQMLLSIRIKLAQRHDDLPTDAELAAKLDVYAEFGR